VRIAHREMAGRQIRWMSLGKVVAIAAAAIVGIVSLPALLGSDAPPPVPPDVGLSPAPVATVPLPAQRSAGLPPVAPKPRPAKHPLARHERVRERPHPHRERPHDHHKADNTRAPPTTLPPTSSSPVYSQAPPPAPGEFQIEP
jgi:hypothetical protein